MNTFTYNRLAQALEGECAAEGEILLPDYCPTVMKIISTDAVAYLRSGSVRGDRVYAEGNVEFRILYLSDTAEGLQCVSHRIPFSYSAQINTGSEEDFIDMRVNIEYKSTRALSPRKLYAKATLNVQTDVYSKECIAFPDEEKTEKTELLTGETEIAYPLCAANKILHLSEDVEAGNIEIDKLLRCETDFFEVEKKPVNKKLIIKEDMLLRLTYLTPSGDIGLFEKKIPVSQIVELPEYDEQSECDVSMTLSDLTLSLTKKGEQTFINCEGEINVRAECIKRDTISIVEDAFSLFENAECVKKEVPLQHIAKINENLDFTQKISIDDFHVLLDTDVRPSIMNITYDEKTNEAVCDGIFAVTVLYKNVEDCISCVEKTLPFTLRTPIDYATESIRSNCRVIVTSLSKTPLTDGIELKIGALYVGTITVTEKAETVTDIILTPKDEENDRCMISFFGQRGDRIWDIAKKYGISPDKIKERNSLTSDTLQKDGMIFIAL